MSEIISGTIEKWTKVTAGVTNNNAWHKVSLLIDGVYYAVFSDKADQNPMITLANMQTNIPAGSTVQFSANMKEYNGKKQGTVIPKTMKMLTKGPDKVANTPAEMLEKVTGRKPESEETRGKVRHGVAIAYIEQGATLHKGTLNEMEEWVEYIMTGKLKSKSKPEPEGPNPEILEEDEKKSQNLGSTEQPVEEEVVDY